MHKAIVEINEMPTVIQTWGRWIEESPKETNEHIILFIPGNPGVTGYYEPFLETLYNELKCPVWIIGHAGHEVIKNKNIKIPQLKNNENLYDVEGQINHKIEFFRKYISANAKVYLVAHSIGCYVSLNLLKHPDIRSKVTKSYFLFPAIEDIGDTPNGKMFKSIIYYITFIIFFMSWIFTLLPNSLQSFLVSTYFTINRIPTYHVPATEVLIHPAVLKKIFFLAFDEFKVIRTLDKNLMESNKSKIKLYYGASDNWAPPSYYRKLIESYPDVDAEICVRKFDHAFVLRSSVDVGKMVADWIKLEK